MLGAMAAAAGEMVASAEDLSGTGETSAQQAANVAAAVGQTSADVQAVATSAEELSASDDADTRADVPTDRGRTNPSYSRQSGSPPVAVS